MQYLSSHPWLTFTLPDGLFYCLAFECGEAASKTDHLRNTPLLPRLAEHLNKIYLQKGIKATTAIEGNTLADKIIEDIIENKGHAPESQNYLEQEVKNILDACNEILRELNTNGELPPLTSQKILNFNAQVLRNLPPNEDYIPGTIRTHSVIVGNVYRGAPAEDCTYLLNRLVDWLNSPAFTPPANNKSLQIPCGLFQAIVAHIYIALIHPFGDGNGRTARLVELYYLLKAGIPSPAAHLLSDHYNKTRNDYYTQLNKISKDKAHNYPLTPFFEYAIRGYLDGIREQIDLIQISQYDILWNQYTYEQFNQLPHNNTTKRQRELALHINSWTEQKKLTFDQLPPSLYSYYQGKTPKCLIRDINKLITLNIIHRNPDHTIQSNKHKILSLCPPTAKK